MFFSTGLAQRDDERERERRERREERREPAVEARQAFPDLPLADALRANASLKAGRRAGEEAARDFWPIGLALAGGLFVLNFLGKKGRRR